MPEVPPRRERHQGLFQVGEGGYAIGGGSDGGHEIGPPVVRAAPALEWAPETMVSSPPPEQDTTGCPGVTFL